MHGLEGCAEEWDENDRRLQKETDEQRHGERERERERESEKVVINGHSGHKCIEKKGKKTVIERGMEGQTEKRGENVGGHSGMGGPGPGFISCKPIDTAISLWRLCQCVSVCVCVCVCV